MNTPQPINELWEYSVSETQEYIKTLKAELAVLLDHERDETVIDKHYQLLQERKQKRVAERV